jgi:hypothetical protein
LRSAPLQQGEHVRLAAWLVLDATYELTRPEAADRLGYASRRYAMNTVERYHIAAALLMIAAETEGLTPFDWWLRTQEVGNLHSSTIGKMREAFEAGATRR